MARRPGIKLVTQERVEGEAPGVVGPRHVGDERADETADAGHASGRHDDGDGHHDAPRSADSSEAADGGGSTDADAVEADADGAGGSAARTSGEHAALEMQEIGGRPGHHGGAPDGERGFPTVVALAVLALGVAAGAIAVRRNRPPFSRLAAGALALQLVGLGWDMAIHAAAGEPLDLFENPGHLLAVGGILLLATVVALPSLPVGLLDARVSEAVPPPVSDAPTNGPPRVHI